MRSLDILSASEIRNRARDFKCSMVAARRQTKLAYRLLQKRYAISIDKAMPINLA